MSRLGGPRAQSGHPSMPASSATQLRGRRVTLTQLAASDWPAWSEVRVRNEAWLRPWEPMRPDHQLDPARDQETFVARCVARDRERQLGLAAGFGLFVGSELAGEINLNNIVRGAHQSASVGYWIDNAKAGNRYVAEAVVVLACFAFEQLRLHRLEVCIVPRNRNSRRVMEVLALREEGVAERFLEIAGTWEDHVRYGITAEEWFARRDEFATAWL